MTVLIHGSMESEKRTLTIVGTAVVLLCLSVVGLCIVFNPFAGRPPGVISVSIVTPYVGQGVAPGTAVVMHGVTIGEVTAVVSLPEGGVRFDADLQKGPAAGLTDRMNIDFKPANYFGVTGVNLMAGNGGQPLRDESYIESVPKGNFTLQALLSRLGEVSTGALTPQLIRVIDRATHYTDALNPLIETALISANAVAQVQTVSTAQLLTNTAGLSVVFPSTANALINAGDNFLHNDETSEGRSNADLSQEEWDQRYIPTLELASNHVLHDVGKLLDTLMVARPVIDAVTELTDVVPTLIRPEGFAQMLADLRSRFEKMYAGPPGQRALQVRIVLDSLPGVAAPLRAMGAP